MKQTSLRCLQLAAICLTAAVAALTVGPPATHAADKPNIILMLSDDQGWSGLSVAMHPDVRGSRNTSHQTPSLEKLASQGMRFTMGYAPAPVCSPTRISIQTGKSPAQLHWTKAAPPEPGHKLTEPRLIKSLDPSETTVAELLNSAGYTTAHYGKWHLSGGGPGEHGYDEHDGDTGNEQAFRFVDPNPVDIFGMAERAESFMKRSRDAGKPFYIQLSWNALHASGNARKTTLAKYQAAMQGANDKSVSVAAITEDLDEGVGRVLQSLDQLKLTDSTYVIYMGDNGASGNRGSALRGGKGGVWEGGIRVPFIVRGPGIEPNSWCHTPVVGFDLLPTFCEWAGIPASNIPANVEGGSLAALLARSGRGEVRRARDFLVFHFPHYQGSDGPQSALLKGTTKLIRFLEDDHVELYDLAKDIGESTNLATAQPETARQLNTELSGYLAAIDAQMPTANPDYDPNAPPVARKGGRNAAYDPAEPGKMPAKGGRMKPNGKGKGQGQGKNAAPGGPGGGGRKRMQPESLSN
ncbi:MAG: sulfatase [Planctomycetota bacterium]